MQQMIERRDAVLKFIVRYKAGHDGVAPSIREIGEACGIPSTSNVKYYLEMLEDEGVIHMDAKSGRTIQVVGGQWVRPEGLGG